MGKLRRTDLAYIAGLFDGEGCIRWNDTPRISLTSCWPWHLNWISRKFGCGSVRTIRESGEKWKTAFRLEMSAGNALRFLAKVQPFLKEKRSQADIMLELVKYPKGSAKRDRMLDRLKEMKRIDYGPH